MNPVLVTGATGRVGRLVVKELLAAGVPVRALTRRPAAAELPAAVEVVAGDLPRPGAPVPGLPGGGAGVLLCAAPPGTAPPLILRVPPGRGPGALRPRRAKPAPPHSPRP